MKSLLSMPKSFSYISEQKQARPSVGPLLVDGVLSDKPETMSEALLAAFSSVFDSTYPPDALPHQSSNGRISSVVFVESEVRRLLACLRKDGGPGPDGLKPLLLKSCASELAVPLTWIFSKSMDLGILPQQFKAA